MSLLLRRSFWAVVLVSWVSSITACGGAVDQRDQALRAHPVSESLAIAALSPRAKRALYAGELVALPMVQETTKGRYTGGVAHLLVNAPAAELFDALSNPQVIQRVLPKTRRASLLGRGQGWQQIELVQGNRWVEATYTVTLRQEPATERGAYRVVFALDRARPHDVDDLWGSFSLTPIDPRRCVVSVAAFVDLGSSMAVLFEGRIQDLILSTPWHVQRYVDEARLKRAAASDR